jgi:adenylate cyclase
MSQKGFKRKLTAILSADVAGYSRLMGDDEASTVETLNIYKKIMTMLIQQHRGKVIDSPGDNLLADFASVVDAVQCGVAVQKELQARNAELHENRRMEFRIGINLGDVIQEENRIYGDGVNVAARLEALSDPGGICISRTVFDHIESKLPLGYEFLGDQTVKNIAKPIGAYRVLMDPRVTVAETIEDIKAKPAKRYQSLVIGGIAVLLIAIGFGIWHFFFRPTEETASIEKMAYSLPDKPSIAVLPFTNMSDDPKQEYFADGITEDLITDLSKISGVFVIARNSTFVYKGKPIKIKQVAEELSVRYVLEGSVRKASNKVRITAQLIDATTGHHLWAERYDGDLGDVFTLQDKVTKEIVSTLTVKLTRSEQERSAYKETENILAYDTLLKGWEHYRRFTPDDFAKARVYFEKAIELDPDYSRAHAALAQTYWLGSLLGWRWQMGLDVDWTEGRILARKHLIEAMQKPTSLAHQVASWMNTYRRMYREAITQAEKALTLDPNDHGAHWIMSWVLIFSGSPDEAIDYANSATRLDPHYTGPNLYLLGLAHFSKGKLKDAAALMERAFAHNVELVGLSAPLAAAYALLGQNEAAKDAMKNYRNEWSWLGSPPNLRNVMQLFPFKDIEVSERLAEGLVKAGLPGQVSEYYKVTKKNQLSGEEIKALIIGRTVTGISPFKPLAWRIHRTPNGEMTYQGNLPFSIYSPGESGSGNSWIEEDLLCDQWEYIFQGVKYCMTVYHNPDGTPEMKNEYFFVTDFGIFPWSTVD